jgi:predicted RNA-binding Zn-ribbon protein involved in translation (DUF1610 family)
MAFFQCPHCKRVLEIRRWQFLFRCGECGRWISDIKLYRRRDDCEEYSEPDERFAGRFSEVGFGLVFLVAGSSTIVMSIVCPQELCEPWSDHPWLGIVVGAALAVMGAYRVLKPKSG